MSESLQRSQLSLNKKVNATTELVAIYIQNDSSK